MKIAILGTGAIGSVFAFQLARAGHAVTVIARGVRLEQLRGDNAIVLASGERAPVEVHATLDTTVQYDLVLVTVLAPQVASVMPALQASAATSIMFMFNTFESIEPLRRAVGATRCMFGFPAGIFCLLQEGRIRPQIRPGTTTDSPPWAKIFTEGGIPTVVEKDMQSWLRSHAALVVPLMAIGVVAHQRGAGISWREAGVYATAMDAGFRLVRDAGNAILPAAIAKASGLPRWVTKGILWALSRTKMLRELGMLGPMECRMLIDMMTAAGKVGAVGAIRP